MTVARALPTLLVSVAVAAVVLLYLFPAEDDTDLGHVLAIMRLDGVGPGEECAQGFEVVQEYDRMNLNYRFTTAIKPRAALVAPDETWHNATVGEGTLDLEIQDPEAGTWTLRVWVVDDPQNETRIDDGEVYILGFPRGTGGAHRVSLCAGSMSGT